MDTSKIVINKDDFHQLRVLLSIEIGKLEFQIRQNKLKSDSYTSKKLNELKELQNKTAFDKVQYLGQV